MVLVTGGTGLVGSHLLYHLLNENVQVRAIHRETSDLEKVKHVFRYYTEDSENLFNQIQWFKADVNDVPALIEAFKDIDTVYHCAAFISFDPTDIEKLRKINIEGTANIVNLCLSNKVLKLCHVSSVAALGSTIDNSLINENTEWNKETDNSVYAISKYGAEMEVWRGTQEGLEAVIVNPSIIVGEGFWNSGIGSILKVTKNEFPFYMTGGMGVVDVKDVVEILIKLMESDIKNKRFIVSSTNVSYKDLLTDLAVLLDKRPPRKPIAKWIMKFFSKLDWISHKLFSTSRRLLGATVKSMYGTSFYDNSKIREALDYEFISYDATLKRVIDFYKKEIL